MPNTPPAPPRLDPQRDPVQLHHAVLLPPAQHDASTTASGLSSLESSPEPSRETSPATSPRDTRKQNDEKRITQGRQ